MSAGGASYKFGKYELVAHLATGGMAEIYVARQTGIAGFEKLLVIKRILPHLAREDLFVKMFFDEARIAAKLSHQNIVQIYDLGHVDEQYYIAMEYLEGESLAKLMRKIYKSKTTLSPALAAGIALQVCEGLHYAHTMVGPDGEAMQVVHRDVNPQNIFVLYSGGVKLVDFGIAKATNRFSHTSTGMLKGKYGYMSPEQIKNLSLDARSDVYSAGVVLWEMLTGRKLFRQASELEILQAITEQDTPPPSTVVSSVPAELDAVCLKALQRSRELRYQTAGEMRMELSFVLKRNRDPSDTVALGEFMQSIFYERMLHKRKLIKEAQDRGSSLEKTLFGDLRLSQPGRKIDADDTEPSISRYTPVFDQESASGAAPASQKAGANERTTGKSRLLPASGAILLVIAVALALFLLWQTGSGPESAADGALASRADDAGLAMRQSPPDDAGAVMVVGPIGADEGMAGSVGHAKRQGHKTKKVRARRKKSAGTATHETSRAPGRLRLATVPWTIVYYKERKLGVTPLVDIELPAGKCTLRAVNTKKGIDKEIVVQIIPGETTMKRIRF
ncbi:MAG TPA: serine/threonine-protein kinase [Myxococcota bacterium]|nr:serine/threonine-protein kinase [Myxococcota bacterium]